jgi:uridine kinase
MPGVFSKISGSGCDESLAHAPLRPSTLAVVPILPLSALCAHINQRPPSAGTTRVVAIDGRAGSGKTVLAHRLAPLVDAPIIHMDDIYPGWDGLADATDKLVEWVLAPLANGQQVAYRRYDWDEGGYAEQVAVPQSEILIVEGCASGSTLAAPFLSLLIWIEAPHDVRIARGIARDGELFAPNWERWAAQEDVLYQTERTRERADLIVDGVPAVPHDPDTEVVSHSIFR